MWLKLSVRDEAACRVDLGLAHGGLVRLQNSGIIPLLRALGLTHDSFVCLKRMQVTTKAIYNKWLKTILRRLHERCTCLW